MRKNLMLFLVLIGFCFIAAPAFPAEFAETNTQEISDEAFTCCVAKGVVKGGDPQRPVIIMKVRATCSEAYTAIHEALKNYKEAPPVPQKQAPAKVDQPDKGKKH